MRRERRNKSPSVYAECAANGWSMRQTLLYLCRVCDEVDDVAACGTMDLVEAGRAGRGASAQVGEQRREGGQQLERALGHPILGQWAGIEGPASSCWRARRGTIGNMACHGSRDGHVPASTSYVFWCAGRLSVAVADGLPQLVEYRQTIQGTWASQLHSHAYDPLWNKCLGTQGTTAGANHSRSVGISMLVGYCYGACSSCQGPRRGSEGA
jgi:hypothetical protein